MEKVEWSELGPHSPCVLNDMFSQEKKGKIMLIKGYARMHMYKGGNWRMLNVCQFDIT